MPTRSGRFWGRMADAFIPGNAYNSTTGRWNPATAKTGIAGMIADQFVPGGSNIVGMAANGGLFGGGLAKDLRNENIYNTMADQYGDFRADLRDQYLDPSVDTGGSYNPSVSVGQPQMVSQGSYSPSIPTTAPVNAQGPWTGLGTSTGNVFGGGGLGGWSTGGNAQRQIGGNLNFGGGVGGYNNGAGAGTGFGAANFTNDSWGQTALGFGIGSSAGGSAGSIALADAITANKKNRV